MIVPTATADHERGDSLSGQGCLNSAPLVRNNLFPHFASTKNTCLSAVAVGSIVPAAVVIIIVILAADVFIAFVSSSSPSWSLRA